MPKNDDSTQKQLSNTFTFKPIEKVLVLQLTFSLQKLSALLTLLTSSIQKTTKSSSPCTLVLFLEISVLKNMKAFLRVIFLSLIYICHTNSLIITNKEEKHPIVKHLPHKFFIIFLPPNFP